MIMAKQRVRATLVLGAMSVMLTSAMACRKPRPTRRATIAAGQETITLSPARTAAVAEQPPISAATLLTAYRANPSTADERFNGQRFLITGTVAEIRQDASGGSIFCLATGSQLTPVFAHGLQGPHAASVRTGDLVTLACSGDGAALGSPVLQDCSLTP